MKRKFKTVLRIIKEEGLITLLIKALEKLNNKAQKRPAGHKSKIQMLVKAEDAKSADWSKPLGESPKHVEPPYKIAWIMSPPGETSGGHQNIFRFMSYLQAAGHDNNVFLYTAQSEPPEASKIAKMLESSPSYPDLDIPISQYKEKSIGADFDAIFATGWETAYPALLSSAKAKRFYFVQDYEPYFYPTGSESVLAENTYKFGFHGVTAGDWLKTKLAKDYKMRTESFQFGADKSTYFITNKQERKEVFFYARPVTPRRGFELGILALEIFANKRPDYKINLAGWDVSDIDISFKYNNLSNMSIDQLNDVYNRCAAGLVISLTNMSLLPLELLSSGVIPVVNDGVNNRQVSSNEYIEYSENSPLALANKMIEVVDRKDLVEHAKLASESVTSNNWDKSGKAFVSIVEAGISG